MKMFEMSREAIGGGASAVALVVVMTACGSSATPSTGGGGANQVSLTTQNTAYQPTTLSVPASQQVTIVFSNKDSIEHSFTFDDNSKSVDADGGETKMLTFTSPASGTISFHCKYHPTQMKGTITVGSAGGAGGSSTSTSSSSSGY